jgi:hypothetical protein
MFRQAVLEDGTVIAKETYLLTCFGEHYLRDSTVIAKENLVQGSKQ